jgi:threonine dehydrogenase-like Zn-dependent dehydrogenase
MTKTYKRSILASPREIVFEEVPIPAPGPGQALVQVKACAVCTWEQRVYSGADTSSYPLLGGHEVSGVLAEVGPGLLAKAKSGDHVVVSPLTRCFQCTSCRRGLNSICDNARASRVPGEPFGPGGLAEYMLVDGYQIYPVPGDVPFVESCLSEPLSCVLHSIKKAQVEPADNVVIIGAGIMGLLHLTILQRLGARVAVSEPNPVRAAKARELGVLATIDPTHEDFVERVKAFTGGCGADVIVAAIGVAGAIQEATRAVAKGGRLMVYASVQPRGSTITIDPNLFHSREIVLTGTVSQNQEDFVQAVSLLTTRTVDVRPLITNVFPFAQLREALEAALNGNNYRVVVTM